MDSIAEYEGTVSPSFLKTLGDTKHRDVLNKLPMRLGRVVRVHNPTDESNRSKSFFEYDVLCEEGSENHTATRVLLPHCLMMSMYGGAADFTKSTPRKLERDKNKFDTSEDFGLGSRVLVMMINASTFGGVIVGGVQHGKGEVDDPAKGHHEVRQFNGIRQEVDKDGQLTISFKGATNADGNLASTASAAASGSMLQLLKDGSVRFSTPSDDQYIHIDHANHDLKLLSRGTFTWESKGASQLTVGATWNVAAQNDITVKTSLGAMELGALNLITTHSSGVHFGSATDAMLMGSTYRTAESTLHTAHTTGFTTVGAQLGTVGGILSSAGGLLQAIGILHKIPVVGAVIGSFPLQAAAAMIMAAGAMLTALGGQVPALLATPITQFEGGAVGYLSSKNRLD